MIKTEFYKTREDGVDLYRTFSDQRMRIHCNEDGHDYDEAVNVQNSGFTFVETDVPIAYEDEISNTQALNIIMGRGFVPDGTETGDAVQEND